MRIAFLSGILSGSVVVAGVLSLFLAMTDSLAPPTSSIMGPSPSEVVDRENPLASAIPAPTKADPIAATVNARSGDGRQVALAPVGETGGPAASAGAGSASREPDASRDASGAAVPAGNARRKTLQESSEPAERNRAGGANSPEPRAPTPPSAAVEALGTGPTSRDAGEVSDTGKAPGAPGHSSAGPEPRAGPEAVPGRLAAIAPAAPATPGLSRPPEPQDPSGMADTPRPPLDPMAPTFDIVRVDAQGQAVIAGRARPGQLVEILLDGEVVETARADSSGNFVAFVSAELAGGARRLQLRVRLPNSDVDAETLPAQSALDTAQNTPSQASGQVSAATPPGETSTSPANGDARFSAPDPRGAIEQGMAGIGLATAPMSEEPAPAVRIAPPSRQLAPPPSRSVAPPPAPGDAVTGGSPTTEGEYDGNSTAPAAPSLTERERSRENTAAGPDTGVAPHPAQPDPAAEARYRVQRYALSAPVLILPSHLENEAPTLVPPERDELALLQRPGGALDRPEGVVLDQLTYGPGGDVQIRGRGAERHAIRAYGDGRLLETVPVRGGVWDVSLPRAAVEPLSLLRFDEIDPAGQVTSRIEAPFRYTGETPQTLRQREVVIQKGDNLWTIAEDYYGEGMRYSVIYGANDDLIRDPDLIYPDQVFSIPELVEAD